MATPKFLESGTDATEDFSHWASTSVLNGTITSDTAHPNTGTQSIKSDVTGSGSNNAYCQTIAGILADAGRRISFYAYFSSVSPASAGCILTCQTSGSSSVLGVGITTGGKLRVAGKGATAVDGTTTLSAGVQYRITLSYVITSASVWSAKVYLNGVLEITTGNAQGNLTTTASSILRMGLQTSSLDTWATTPILTVWLDDIYVDDGTGIDDTGDIRVTAKRPFANGTTNGFTTQIGAGGSGYGTGHAPQVNEQPLSTTNGWSMIGAGSAITEEYNIEGLSVGDEDLTGATIVAVEGWIYAKALANETASMVLDGVSSNVALTNANTMFVNISGTTFPAGTGADIGLITTTALTTVSLYECGVLIAYTPASSDTMPPMKLQPIPRSHFTPGWYNG